MYINKLNQLYKPKRILFYIEASKEIVDSFNNGIIPEELSMFNDSYGTYDGPGLFYIKDMDPVIGIEYRLDDKNINYPKNLKSKILEESYFYSVEIDDDFDTSISNIKSFFKEIGKDDDAKRIYSYLKYKTDPNVITIFNGKEKKRMQHEWYIEYSNTIDVIEANKDKIDKDMLYDLAFIDPITKHFNWNHLVPYLETPSLKGITDYAFVHFDIKEFRIINEVYGHIAGNKILKKVVKKMNEENFIYTSARCHNDNFAMIIKDMPQDEMEKCLTNFFKDLSHLEEDPNYSVYYRCGVVPMKISMQAGNRVADFGKFAQALNKNSNPKTDINFYTDEMHSDMLWSNYIKAYLDTAIKNDEFVVYLQPKFDINKEVIEGSEALVRWNYESKAFLPPYRFIPFFEKDYSIGKIDDIVLEKVCMALDKWKKEGKNLYPVSVNLSRIRLFEKNLINHLTEIVDKYNVDHSLIDFELTESASYSNKEKMVECLLELRKRNFKTSMDDFGTGYSSLSLLKEMPLDTLKIDKSFVDNLGTDKENEKDTIVLKHIISLAKNLSFNCLAEGAEMKSQVDKLRNLGCEIIQGYYYSKPISISDFEKKYLN